MGQRNCRSVGQLKLLNNSNILYIMEKKFVDDLHLICEGDEFTSSSGSQVVFLEGFSGYF